MGSNKVSSELSSDGALTLMRKSSDPSACTAMGVYLRLNCTWNASSPSSRSWTSDILQSQTCWPTGTDSGLRTSKSVSVQSGEAHRTYVAGHLALTGTKENTLLFLATLTT